MKPIFILLAILLIMAVAIGICSVLGIDTVLKMIRWSLPPSTNPLLSSVISSTYGLSPHHYALLASEEEEAMLLRLLHKMTQSAQENASREKTAPPPPSRMSPCQEYERAIAIAKEKEETEASETESLVKIFGERARRPPSPTTTPSYAACEEFIRFLDEKKAEAEAKAKERTEPSKNELLVDMRRTPLPTSTPSYSPCEEYERAIAIAKENEETEAFETELLVRTFGERARRPPSPTTTPSYSPCEEYLRSIEEEEAIADAKAQEEWEAKSIAIARGDEKALAEAEAFELELLNDIFTVREERLPPPSIRPWDLHEWIRFNANAGEPDKD